MKAMLYLQKNLQENRWGMLSLSEVTPSITEPSQCVYLYLASQSSSNPPFSAV